MKDDASLVHVKYRYITILYLEIIYYKIYLYVFLFIIIGAKDNEK